MISMAKQCVWAITAIICVYLASTHAWTPFQVVFKHEGQFIKQQDGSNLNYPIGFRPQGQPLSERNPQDLIGEHQTNAAPLNPVIAPVSQPQSADQASITDPAIASKVQETLFALQGVDDFGKDLSAQKIIYTFFDPRCPYCGEAFKAMNGKLPVKWIPVIVLGNPEEGSLIAASLLSSPDRLEMMRKLTDGTLPALTGEPSSDALGNLKINLEHYAAIVSAAPNLQKGVPMFFVPDPQGGLTIKVGYETGDNDKIAAILKGQK